MEKSFLKVDSPYSIETIEQGNKYILYFIFRN